jgi:hypothetical protein
MNENLLEFSGHHYNPFTISGITWSAGHRRHWGARHPFYYRLNKQKLNWIQWQICGDVPEPFSGGWNSAFVELSINGKVMHTKSFKSNASAHKYKQHKENELSDLVGHIDRNTNT